jgi:hypothetical protein
MVGGGASGKNKRHVSQVTKFMRRRLNFSIEFDITFSPIAVPRYLDCCIGVVRMMRSARLTMEAKTPGCFEGSAGVKMIIVGLLAVDTAVAEFASSMSLHDRFRHYTFRSE